MFKNLLAILASLNPLIAKIRELFGDIPIQDIIAILTRLLNVGAPPEIKDEQALRDWLTNLAVVADEIAELTPVAVDDTATDFLMRMIASDNVWGVFYTLLTAIADGADPDHVIVQSQIDAVGELREFNPAMLIMIAEVVMKLIELFRNR